METGVYCSRKGKIEIEGSLNREIWLVERFEIENEFQM
jgi:hypothetical protein